MAFQVEITRRALLDAEEAYVWFSEQSPQWAERWLNGLLEAVNSLEEFPTMCAVLHDGRAIGKEIRQYLYGRGRTAYRLFFEIRGDTVFILRIRHGSRKPITLAEMMEE
jgi:plasmid stabilization system protein ParE